MLTESFVNAVMFRYNPVNDEFVKYNVRLALGSVLVDELVVVVANTVT